MESVPELQGFDRSSMVSLQTIHPAERPFSYKIQSFLCFFRDDYLGARCDQRFVLYRIQHLFCGRSRRPRIGIN
jgi:hypothetical protein